MEPGTWAEWFGAVGALAAAGTALFLIFREGQDRQQLQRSEIRRERDERRRQATHVHVGDIEPGVRGTSGDDRWAHYSVKVLNGSDRIINHAFIDLILSPRLAGNVADFADTEDLGRLLPGAEVTITRKILAPRAAFPKDDPGIVGTCLWFSDAAGTVFQINETHDVTEVDMNPHRPR